jgi:glucose/arabinose dehydrogenase
LRGPRGLSASVFATGLTHVAALAEDDRGRFWAATADYTARGADGVYLVTGPGTTATKVIGGVQTPLGLLWDADALYVASAGGVVAYSGFDGTQFAHNRRVLSLPADVGEVNELALGPDGHLLLGISAPCDHCTPALADSAAIVSFRPDGSDISRFASGIRAPVGLAFVPGTGDLLVTMNQRDDLGADTPGDWLGLVRAGQQWGFPACYGQGGSVCSGVPQPVAALDKHAAVSGVAMISSQLSNHTGGVAAVAEWALGKVQAVDLVPTRGGYKGTVTPLLTGMKNPVPLLTTRSGDLLVGDWGTGTIYKISRGGQ